MEIEEAGQDNAEVIETEAANSPEQSTPEATPQGNPHWKEVEEKLGPNNYAVIKPYLDKADTEHRQGIESLNTRFKPFQSFIEQGVTPEVITQSLGLRPRSTRSWESSSLRRADSPSRSRSWKRLSEMMTPRTKIPGTRRSANSESVRLSSSSSSPCSSRHR